MGLIAVMITYWEILVPFAVILAAYNHIQSLRERLRAERNGIRNPDGSISVPYRRIT